MRHFDFRVKCFLAPANSGWIQESPTAADGAERHQPAIPTRGCDMNMGDVPKKIVLCLSAAILMMVCTFAYLQLRDIEGQSAGLRAESVPELYLSRRLRSGRLQSGRLRADSVLLEAPPDEWMGL